MPNKTTHSPLPWSEDPEGEVSLAIEDANGNVVCDANEADAALIVRAVNSHADLLAALKTFVERP